MIIHSNRRASQISLIVSLVFLSIIASLLISQQSHAQLTLQEPCPKGSRSILIALHRSPRDPSIKAPKALRGDHRVVLKRDRAWLKAQLREANRLFSSIQVCFWMRDEEPISDAESRPSTRRQRTALGRVKDRIQKGRIDLFIVNRLGDIDIAGAEIRGVHWRDPKDRQRLRWILLSRIAKPLVLAHELGHYFGLPHSRYPQSIMNKAPRKSPLMRDRGFVPQEYQIMKRWRDKMYPQH